MADQILYDHGGIESGANSLSNVGGKAQDLLNTGNSSRSSLEGSWDGAAGASFQDAFNKFTRINQRIIDVTMRAVQSLHTGNNEMADTDRRLASMFGA